MYIKQENGRYSITDDGRNGDGIGGDFDGDDDGRNLTIKLRSSESLAEHCDANGTNQVVIPLEGINGLEDLASAINLKGLSNSIWSETCRTYTDSNNSRDVGIKFATGTDLATIVEGGEYEFRRDSNQALGMFIGEGISNYVLDTDELYTLYSFYLAKRVSFVNGVIDCNGSSNSESEIFVPLISESAVRECRVSLGGDPSEIRVWTQQVNRFPVIKNISMQEVLEWLEENTKNVNISNVIEIEDITRDVDATTEETDGDACLSSNTGFNYIICPLISFIANTANGVYTELVEPSLRVEPELFSGGTNNVISQVWGIFRDIANVIFVIVLLVVIISQLTGYGITNYGIKKLLPKLIIAVVFINISYLFCLACVDLSNIAGNSLKGLFDGLGTDLPAMVDIMGEGGASYTINNASGAGIISIGLLGGAAAAITAVTMGPFIILSVLVSAITVLFSIFFMFILLAARQAAIIVLIIISPVVVVLYILPNTQKFFDKMMKIWWAMLLLYPIMGLLIGGGNFVAKLLLNIGFASSGTFQAFAAIVIGIVPIFLAPELVTNAFAGLNNIGAKISGVGKNMGRATQAGVKNTDFYKNAEAASQEHKALMGSGFKRNKDGSISEAKGLRKAFGTFISGGTQGRRRNALRYQKMVAERGSLEAADEKDFMLETETQNEMKRIIASGEIAKPKELQDGLAKALLSGNRGKIRAYTDALDSKGENGRNKVIETYDGLAKSISNESRRIFAANIMQNHSDAYKNNRRSMWNIASDIVDTNGATNETNREYLGHSENRKKLIESLKASTISAMDDVEFEKTIQHFDDDTKGWTENDWQGFGEILDNALENEGSMKEGRAAIVRGLLEKAESKGYQRRVQRVHEVGGGGTAPSSKTNSFITDTNDVARLQEEFKRNNPNFKP